MAEGAGILTNPYGEFDTMFIAHGEFLRKYAHWILAGVLLLLLPGFVLLFSPTASMKQQRASLPTINGKPIELAEFQNAREAAAADIILGKGRQARTSQMEDQISVAAVQRLILMRKAKELGIRVTDDELVQQIRALPVLLNEQTKQFDPDRYQRYIISLNNLNVTEMQFEEAMRTQIILSRLRALVGSGAKVTPTDLQLSYIPLHEQTTIDYVEFNASDRKESFDIKDDEAKAYYEKNKEHLRTPAVVKARYVIFSIPEAKKSVKIGDEELVEYYDRNKEKYLDTTGKPKFFADVKDEVKKDLTDIRAERLAGDRATAFTVKLVPEGGAVHPDFTKTAADSGLSPQETDFFNLRDPVPNVHAGQQFNQAAFSLTPDMSISDPIRGEDGYYVMEYVASKPSGIPPFEQVKSQVLDRIRQQRAYEAAVANGRELSTKVKDAVAAGKSFSEACASLNLKPKILGPFTLTDVTTNFAAANQIKEVALGMQTNSVSDFISTPTGGLFFHLKTRTAPKPEDLEKDKQQLETQLLDESREALFQDWANSVIRAEHVDYKLKTQAPQQQQPAEDTEPDGQSAPAS
jgi:peptidyl-prolyl cis-trans isomerase D